MSLEVGPAKSTARSRLGVWVVAVTLALAPALDAQTIPSKPATAATRAANAKVLQSLPFNDTQDFADADRGFIARPDTLTIKNDKGQVVWDLESFKSYIAPGAPAPDTVNPSLWRNAQLNLHYGLYKVTDRIYQVRGYDITNITFVQGDTGWIVLDPLISPEPARAAYDLVSQHLGKRPIAAVIYSHSHIDHFGGVRGLVDGADVAAGKTPVIAPEGFTEHAISENVIAGNAMARRAIYMYGALLPRNPQGSVGSGLGMTNSIGATGLIVPTRLVSKTGTEIDIDGVRMIFQMTPGTEAPAEMNTFFPQFRAMWMAENTTDTMHNILTLRGAQVRDALKWSSYINETINLYGKDIDVKFQSHHWPVWGNARIVDYLKKQRDLYKYIHDQSVHLMNQGLVGSEIAEQIKLPPELDQYWPNRGYYGTLKHNSRAVYQRYMGWYDGNPSDLDDLPPEAAAKKYVEYMGGAEAVIKRAQADFDQGNYRWVAMALKHVVFADPNNRQAQLLLADAYEQMGYQAESGPWRGVYLQGAYELRNGVPKSGGLASASADAIRAMPVDMLFDYLSVLVDGQKAAGQKINLNFNFTDLGKAYGVTLENGVLNYGPPLAAPDATISLAKTALDDIQLKTTTPADAIAKGDVKVEGDAGALKRFLAVMDPPKFWFNIVTP
jgi:alkyl sulfatase BDS1-like metallo-beta-lactamase superfamily hydrolase